jgi:hypothetical protein
MMIDVGDRELTSTQKRRREATCLDIFIDNINDADSESDSDIAQDSIPN